MKKIIYIFLLSVIFNYAYSQIAYMHYVTVKNSDVKEHIEAEKNVHSKLHKEEIDKERIDKERIAKERIEKERIDKGTDR